MKPDPLPVTDLAEARLLKDMAALAQAERRVAELRAKVQAGCRRYSDDNGYRVVLTPDQVRRAMEADRG